MDAATFRNDFPAFLDSNAYPDAQVNFWLGIGTKQLNACVFGDMYDYALELFTAHNISLETINQKNAKFGGQPGASSGPTASKSVDKVSISYDTAVAAEAGAGHWNLTNYGLRLKRLIDMVGAGGIQVGGCGGYVLMGPGFWNGGPL